MITEKTFLQMFAEAVRQYPDKVAIADQDGRRMTTYAELNRLSSRICAALKKQGVQSGMRVPVCMERGMEYIAAEIGVMKRGCAFVALSADYPQSRIDYIRKDCGASMVLDEAFVQKAQAELPELSENVKLTDTAFCIYTSGSTGNPKGIVHSHLSMASAITRNCMVFESAAEDIQLCCAPLSFIAMLVDIYTPLAIGQTVHILPENKRKDIRALEQYIKEHRITCCFISPQMLKLLRVENSSLRLVLTGSERVIRIVGKGYRFMNLFGCSETAATVLGYEVLEAHDNTPIGKPVPGIDAFLMDDNGKRVAPGSEGELIIVGDIAHEYINLPEQTKAAFERQPDGRILFHTNDICRLLPDGNFVYVDRKDWMVKINGQRVELGEIEAVLTEIAEIGSAAVKGFVNANGQTYLCAYYTLKQPLDEAELRERLGIRLPGYMMPQYLIQMDALPLNPNGKLDRKNLKAPDVQPVERPYEAPVTEKESMVCAAFEKVLHRPKVGRREDFFEIGGDSIQAIMLTLELEGLDVAEVYERKTPEEIAAAWDGCAARAVNTAKDAKFQNLYDEQGRMEILAGMRYYKKTRDENNMPRLALRLKEPVDAVCLKAALEETLPRFKVQCMKVVADKARYYLKVNDAPPVLHVNDGSRQVTGGDENNGYLTRVGYAGNEITVDMFHGVCDGVGTMPFLKSLLYAYCHRKYGVQAAGIPELILPDTPEDPREAADCMLFLQEEPVQSEGRYQWKQGFSLPDEQMESAYACAHYHLNIDAAAMDRFVRANDTSVSAAFSLLVNRVIASCNKLDGLPVVAAMAIDARSAYHAEKTMQCCVGTLPVYYDEEMAGLPLREQLRRTRDIVLTQAKPQNVIAAAQGTRRFNQKLEQDYPTLEEKKQYCVAINKRSGGLYTYGISYIGEFRMGPGLDEHISEMCAMLPANTLPLIIEILKFGSEYQLTWMSHFVNDRYVNMLCDLLKAEGISVTCERRADFEESIAVFEE